MGVLNPRSKRVTEHPIPQIVLPQQRAVFRKPKLLSAITAFFGKTKYQKIRLIL